MSPTAQGRNYGTLTRGEWRKFRIHLLICTPNIRWWSQSMIMKMHNLSATRLMRLRKTPREGRRSKIPLWLTWLKVTAYYRFRMRRGLRISRRSPDIKMSTQNAIRKINKIKSKINQIILEICRSQDLLDQMVGKSLTQQTSLQQVRLALTSGIWLKQRWASKSNWQRSS